MASIYSNRDPSYKDYFSRGLRLSTWVLPFYPIYLKSSYNEAIRTEKDSIKHPWSLQGNSPNEICKRVGHRNGRLHKVHTVWEQADTGKRLVMSPEEIDAFKALSEENKSTQKMLLEIRTALFQFIQDSRASYRERCW